MKLEKEEETFDKRLAEMGIRTLGEARRASEKTYYARVKY